MRQAGLAAVTVLTLALALTGGASAQSGEPLATIVVPPGPKTTTTFDLQANTLYTFVISGTTVENAQGDSTFDRFMDIFYCYRTEPPVACSSPEWFDHAVWVVAGQRMGSSAFFREGNFGTGRLPEEGIAYASSHQYTVTVQRSVGGRLELEFPRCKPDVVCEGPGYTIRIYLGAAEEPEATLGGLKGKVEVQHGGGAWAPAKPGEKLKAGDRIHTGFKATATLTFPDGSTMVIKPMSYVHIQDIESSPPKVRVMVRLGEVKATVRHPPGQPADYEVATPTATASVRGTTLSVLYDALARAALFSAHDDTVSVDPVAAGLETTTLTTGQEIEVLKSTQSEVAAIGQAGAPPGSVNRAKALGLVLAKIAKTAKRCKVTVQGSKRGASDTISLDPTATGWRAETRLTGKNKGKTVWNVVGKKKVNPANKLARRIAGGCD